jgi:hypothetical protein
LPGAKGQGFNSRKDAIKRVDMLFFDRKKDHGQSRRERRDYLDRKAGIYYKLPEHKKNAVNKIIEILDKEENTVDDEKRRDDRYVCKGSEFVHVNFALKDGAQKVRVYDLKVNDCAQNGLGIVITAKDAGLIKNMGIGDQLKNITFFSPWKVDSIDGIITHKTRIKGDYNKETYIIGLKSSEPLKKYKPGFQ